jgi:CRP/FNR family transcriptional regulator, cyclic AMP receptor protein
MRVRCEKCDASFKVEERKIPPEGRRARCGRCGHGFRILPPAVPLPVPPIFRVVGVNHCPLYANGDEFQLSGSIFAVPLQKAPCLILAKDVAALLRKGAEVDPPPFFQCSGCKGMIRFAVRPGSEAEDASSEDRPDDDYIERVVRSMSHFSIFRALDNHIVREFAARLRFDEFGVGDVILRKGDPGRNLYILVSGRVEVLGDDDMPIAEMGRGEVFGEMSLLSGNTVGATIRAVEPATVLYINGPNFKTVLGNSPSLQMYFTRLLAGRMAEINAARHEEFSSGLSGKISEMTPSELFQVFHLNQKTGILTLISGRTSADISFRDGELVRVHYNGQEGPDAFYELLKVKRGRFSFRPGLPLEQMQAEGMDDFMQLLMEGLRRIDEDERRFLQTVFPTLL